MSLFSCVHDSLLLALWVAIFVFYMRLARYVRSVCLPTCFWLSGFGCLFMAVRLAVGWLFVSILQSVWATWLVVFDCLADWFWLSVLGCLASIYLAVWLAVLAVCLALLGCPSGWHAARLADGLESRQILNTVWRSRAPTKHTTLIMRWFKVGPASPTLNQRRCNVLCLLFYRQTLYQNRANDKNVSPTLRQPYLYSMSTTLRKRRLWKDRIWNRGRSFQEKDRRGSWEIKPTGFSQRLQIREMRSHDAFKLQLWDRDHHTEEYVSFGILYNYI